MKRLLQRALPLLALVIGLTLQMAAQSVQLEVTMQDGSGQTFLLSSTDRMYFEDNDFLVIEGDFYAKSEIKIALADIRKITCGEWVGIEEDHANGMGIFPNPVHDVLTLTSLSGTQTVGIYTPDGRLVSSFEADASQPIDVSHLPIGLYLVKTESATLKMIKL